MTGDGVNDAPALKKADCGFAVSGATDAARAAASIVLVAPGLPVIINSIKESRKIFQRMNSYAMYRIAETLRVLLFMTLAIVVFSFYPLTAIMIVMLAMLNDGAILSIAYDNVLYSNRPEAWNMRTVLGIATVLGLVGPIAAFGLFYLGDRVFHIDRPQIQTMMYLMLSVAGHLTIFQTRTRGPWWSIRPARILWMAVLGTQTAATLICVFGFLVTPLWWGWAAFVWGYALAWFLVTDPLKLLAYRVLDATKAASKQLAKAETKPETKAASQPEAKPDVKLDAKGERKPDAKEPKPDAKDEPPAETKATPQPEAKAEPKPDPKAEPKVETKTSPQPEARAEPKTEPKTEAKAEPKAEIKAAPQPEAKAEPKPDAKAEPKAETKAAPQPEAKAGPKSRADTGGAALLKTSLGDLLVAGLVKDPEDAGRVIAAAIAGAPSVVPKAPAAEAEAEPRPEPKAETKAGAKPDAETRTSSNSKLQTAK